MREQILVVSFSGEVNKNPAYFLPNSRRITNFVVKIPVRNMSITRWITTAAMAIITLCAGFSAHADQYRGEKTLGITVGYNTCNSRPLAGAQFSFRFNRLLRLSPAAEYVFRNDGCDALLVDLNMEFVFPFAKGRCEVYPLAGINFSSWNNHDIPEVTIDPEGKLVQPDDVSSRVSRFGLNLGAGFGVNISGSLRLSVSGTYTIIKEFHGANISAGIHYRF